MKKLHEVIWDCSPMEEGTNYHVRRWKNKEVISSFKGKVYSMDKFVEKMVEKYSEEHLVAICSLYVVLTEGGDTHFAIGETSKDYCTFNSACFRSGYFIDDEGDYITFTKVRRK